MAKVGIVMGSDSDMPVMAKAAEILDKLGIDYAPRWNGCMPSSLSPMIASRWKHSQPLPAGSTRV